MITLPNWLFAALLYFAGVGFCVFAWGIWLLGDELHTKRKDAHKGKKEEDEYRCICTETPVCRNKAECKQAREYQEICDWLIAEIERTLQEN